MRSSGRIGKTFRALPLREKILVFVLILICVYSLSQFIITKIRFPLTVPHDIVAEGTIGHLRALNPLYVDLSDADRDVARLVFSGLITYDPVKKNFLPDLAQSWEHSKSGLTYTFTLRSDALWHDGTPVTSDDVLFTIRDIIQNADFHNPLIKNSFDGVQVSAPSPATVVFVLKKPNSYFISNLTVGILPKHILQNPDVSKLEKSSFNQHPIGSGPYAVNSVKFDANGDTVDFTAYDKYYGNKPTVQHLRLYTFPDEATLVKEANALHALSKLSTAGIGQLKKENRFTSTTYTLNQFTALYLNTGDAFLSDKKIRQALAVGLDKNLLLSENETRVDALDLQNHSKDPGFAYNLTAAEKMLDDDDFKKGANGIRQNSKGQRLSLSLLVAPKIPQSTADALQNQMKQLGIELLPEQADSTDFTNYLNERRYSVLLIGQNLGYNRDVYPLFHSTQTGGIDKEDPGLNFSNFTSFQVDALTEGIRKELNPPDKEKLLVQLSKVIADETPVIFLSTRVYSYALDTRITGFPFSINFDFHSDRFAVLPFLTFTNH